MIQHEFRQSLVSIIYNKDNLEGRQNLSHYFSPQKNL